MSTDGNHFFQRRAGARPGVEQGSCVYEDLFSAGSILAHQDWMRMKCGAGLAIATAFKAVSAFSTSACNG